MFPPRSPVFRKFSIVLARLALSLAFLSSVADRFGAWGAHGTSNVTWGDFQHFITYTETLTPFVPRSVSSILAWLATVSESALGFGLLLGLRTKTFAFAAGCLLLVFASAVMFSPAGPHAVFAWSVLSAAGCAMLLATTADDSA
jgi:uncharacterized membrane protein YphA (DoxX/SURF4 family)